MESKKRILSTICVFSLFAAGLVVMYPFIIKHSNKVYKANSKKILIDFDSLGPEIVKKDKQKEG